MCIRVLKIHFFFHHQKFSRPLTLSRVKSEKIAVDIIDESWRRSNECCHVKCKLMWKSSAAWADMKDTQIDVVSTAHQLYVCVCELLDKKLATPWIHVNKGENYVSVRSLVFLVPHFEGRLKWQQTRNRNEKRETTLEDTRVLSLFL